MEYIKDGMGYVVPMLVVIALWCAVMMLTIGKKRINIKNVAALGIFGVYLTIVFSVTVSPMYGFTTNIDMTRVNFKVLKVMDYAKSNPLNLFGNVAMFVPIGILLPLVSKRFCNIIRNTLTGVGISLTIETLQLFLGRGTDVDDLILNAIGMVIGGLVAKLIVKQQSGKSNRYEGRASVYSFIAFVLIMVLIIGAVKRQQYIKDGVDVKDIFQEYMNTNDKESYNLDSINIKATNVCIINGKTGNIVYSKSPEEQVAPASLTKMVTALTALDYCSLDDEVTVGDELDKVASDASVAGLIRGDELTVNDLLYAMMLPSGNDAAITLAAYSGRKIKEDYSINYNEAIDTFVDKMNEKAKDLGADDSNFVRPDGYDADGQYTTALDMARIGKVLLANDTLSEVVSTQSKRCVFINGRDVTFTNTNELLNRESDYYDEKCIGIKTGSSGLAGKCLVSAEYIDDELYICVVMGDVDEDRFTDSYNAFREIEKQH